MGIDAFIKKKVDRRYIDYCMPIFISNPILARGRCMSAWELSGLRADIQREKAKL